jgi:hypothetical protein
MKLEITIPAFLLFATITCKAQKKYKQPHPNFYAGIGFGLDYGGIGCKEGVSVKNESSYA